METRDAVANAVKITPFTEKLPIYLHNHTHGRKLRWCWWRRSWAWLIGHIEPRFESLHMLNFKTPDHRVSESMDDLRHLKSWL